MKDALETNQENYRINGKVSYYWGKILRRKIISELLASILKFMSFIKLVLCNGHQGRLNLRC